MPQNVRLCVRTPEHRIPNSVYCPPHMIHNAKACSSSSGRQAGSSNRSSSSRQQNDECRYNDTNAMGNVKVSNVNKSHNDRAEGEKSAVVAAAVAKCIDRSAISIYGTRSQHADMSIRITHINSALSFHSFQRSSMARVVVVCLSTCVLKKCVHNICTGRRFICYFYISRISINKLAWHPGFFGGMFTKSSRMGTHLPKASPFH